MNEVIVLLVTYAAFIFTDFVPDVKVKFALGYFFSGLILIHLAFNTLILIPFNLRNIRKRNAIWRELKTMK